MRGQVQGDLKGCRHDNDVGKIKEKHSRILRFFVVGAGVFCAFISFRSIHFVLIGPVVHECAHFELFINFSAIWLDFVVLARITRQIIPKHTLRLSY